MILDKNFQYREDKWIWHLMLRVQRGIVTVFDFCSTAQEPNFVGLIWSLNIRETNGIEETALFKVSHNHFVCLTITGYDSQDFIDHTVHRLLFLGFWGTTKCNPYISTAPEKTCGVKTESLTHKDCHFGGKTKFGKRQATRKLSEQVFWIRKMYGTIGWSWCQFISH